MTTRHTISHADEIYIGDAFQGGYSPDGRRGIKMTHLYAHEFLSTAGVPALAADADLFMCGIASNITGWSKTGGNLISVMSGLFTTGGVGATIINLDVPRNIQFRACDAGVSELKIKVEGTDVYGEPMAEAILTNTAGTVACGFRAFKTINKIYCTAALVSMVHFGSGNKLGLPFHIADKGKIVSITVDGAQVSTAAVTAAYRIAIGASSATTMTSSGGRPDARGTIQFLSPAPDGSKRFTALMMVDHSTRRKAFGPPQVSLCSNG